MSRRPVVLLSAFLLLLPAALTPTTLIADAGSATLVVDDDGRGSVAGCDTTAPAFPTPSSAIAAAHNGDTILVCPGTYIQPLNFSGRNVALRSVSGPAVTILDADSADTVITFASGETSAAAVEGFTIRNGQAVAKFPSYGRGGGLVVYGSSPTIRGNVIVNNRGCDSNAIWIDNGSPLIERNTIEGNTQSGCIGGMGGAIGIEGTSNAVLRRNTIRGNTTSGSGGGIAVFGGASNISMNLIAGNHASNGGGLYVVNDAAPILANNVIAGNTAQRGAGIYWSPGPNQPFTLIAFNTIANNGGAAPEAVYLDGTIAPLNFAANVIAAADGQSAVNCGAAVTSSLSFDHNDVFAPSAAAYTGACADPTGASGNISVDPSFADASAGDYHLSPGSPCIDAAIAVAPAGSLSGLDIDEGPRALDGDGNGSAVPDIGADESPAGVLTPPAAFAKRSPAPSGTTVPSTTVTVSWTASAAATAYEVCYDSIDNGVCDGTWLPVRSGTSMVLPLLDPGTTYYWQVRAANGGGTTAADAATGYARFTTPPATRVLELSGGAADSSIARNGRLTIRNGGNAPLTVSRITYPSWISGEWTGTLAPGATTRVPVIFSDAEPGAYAAGSLMVSADQTSGSHSLRIADVANPPAVTSLWWQNTRSGQLAAWDMRGVRLAASLAVTPSQVSDRDWVLSGSGDFSGDGEADLLWLNQRTGRLALWQMNGTTFVQAGELMPGSVGDPHWRIRGVADMDRDGKPDIVWQHDTDGWLSVWLMDGLTLKEARAVTPNRVSAAWRLAAVADLDRDGNPDFVWQNTATGFVTSWLMSGTSFNSTGLLTAPSITDVNWQLRAAVDLDGDGNADLVWHNQATGALVAWFMDHTTLLAGLPLSPAQVAGGWSLALAR